MLLYILFVWFERVLCLCLEILPGQKKTTLDICPGCTDVQWPGQGSKFYKSSGHPGMLKAQSLSLHTRAVLKFSLDSVCTAKGIWTYRKGLMHPELVTLCVSDLGSGFILHALDLLPKCCALPACISNTFFFSPTQKSQGVIQMP